MVSYRITSTVLGAVIAGVLLLLVRRNLLYSRYALWWLSAAGAALLLGIFPGIVDAVGNRLGVTYPPILLVVICLGMMLIKMLTMDLDRSKQQSELRRLAQRLALLEGGRDDVSRTSKAGDHSEVEKR